MAKKTKPAVCIHCGCGLGGGSAALRTGTRCLGCFHRRADLAKKAMKVLLRIADVLPGTSGSLTAKRVAEAAYEQADAMLDALYEGVADV